MLVAVLLRYLVVFAYIFINIDFVIFFLKKIKELAFLYLQT